MARKLVNVEVATHKEYFSSADRSSIIIQMTGLIKQTKRSKGRGYDGPASVSGTRAGIQWQIDWDAKAQGMIWWVCIAREWIEGDDQTVWASLTSIEHMMANKAVIAREKKMGQQAEEAGVQAAKQAKVDAKQAKLDAKAARAQARIDKAAAKATKKKKSAKKATKKTAKKKAKS